MKVQKPVPNTPNLFAPSLVESQPISSSLLQKQIKTKIDTFVKWDARSYLLSRRSRKTSKKQQNKNMQTNDMIKALLKFVNDIKKKQQRQNNMKRKEMAKLEHSSQTNRQKFKKMSNPLEFINYYTNTHRFQPKQQQKQLIDKLVQIKAYTESMDTFNLDRILGQIYKLMNMAVDFNEVRLMILAIILAAEISMQAKDFNRAFYFFNQAKIAALYSGLCEIAVQALINMSKIVSQLQLVSSSIIFLKKALAYAWKINDTQSQLQIYDLLGQNYCQQGKMERAEYYHQRFAKDQVQKQNSAIRKIYIDSIKEDAKGRNLRLYSDHLDSLFLQTVNLPIYNFQILPPYKTKNIFENYVNGYSPRKNFLTSNFSYESFESVDIQIRKILYQSEFRKQLPNPDIQIPYTQKHRYGKYRKQVDFCTTIEFHRITKTKIDHSPPKSQKKVSLEKELQEFLNDKMDPNWYQKMSKNIMKQRMQKMGSLRNIIHRSHLKSHERKRFLSSNSQKIRTSVNKAILNWIDPPE